MFAIICNVCGPASDDAKHALCDEAHDIGCVTTEESPPCIVTVTLSRRVTPRHDTGLVCVIVTGSRASPESHCRVKTTEVDRDAVTLSN